MRFVKGYEKSRVVLSESRRLDLSSVPEAVLDSSERMFGERLTPLEVVSRIVEDVRENGDEAIRRLSLLIEGSEHDLIEVDPDIVAAAADSVDERVLDALATSAERVRDYHQSSMTNDWMDFAAGYGALVRPCERVGVYIPGGSAPLPSTAIMTAIPARVAGVEEIILCSPAKSDGLPDPVVLAAARIAGVDRVFAIGGAQAIAAMAYGTESVPAVDMVCGPGNLFVTLAKKLVYGDVGIDGLYGPTETLIIADSSANPTLCAADLLAQAEHDALARPVLVCTSEPLGEQVAREVETRLRRLSRESVARASVEGQGTIALVETTEQAIHLANLFAPEHMCLAVRDPWSWVGKIKNAGAVFLGEFSHEVLGDYVAGPSHVMPTSGTARFNSGVGVHKFLKTIPVIALDDAESMDLSQTAAVIARAEGLTAHAEAAEIRQELA
ncbi:MAG: histidinol dehydrogenase [Dehalococcoidia bacterium]|nr:histidinol dehydrogenase [Dehalococcoidia bacterium]